MSDIWNFSPDLINQVQQCISAASKTENNKWAREFGHLKPEHNPTYRYNVTKDEKKTASQCFEASPIVLSDDEVSTEKFEQQNCDATVENEENIEQICEYVDTELSSNFNIISEECIKNNKLLLTLVNRLTLPSIERLCTYIYDRKNVNKNFLIIFFNTFLPALVKRFYNCSTLDLLLKGSKVYPTEFDKFLRAIVKDLEVSNNCVQDYIQTLNEKEKSSFLLLLSDLDLTVQEFTHHLFSIYLAYKDSNKSECVQKYLQYLLIKYAEFCSSDKSYGRLLLLFLQTLKQMKFAFDLELEYAVEHHRSAFKRPCINILNDIQCNVVVNNDMNDL